MKETIYVFGHQNPDTDSICSAIAYANLKNTISPDKNFLPIALKAVNKETAYALKHFDVEAPTIVKSLKPQVLDITLSSDTYVHENDSIRKTLETIIDQVGRSAPVVDSNGRLSGVVSISDIVPTYLSLTNESFLKDMETPFENLINELSLEVVSGTIEEWFVSGNTYLSSDLNAEHNLTKSDLIICDGQELATLFETKNYMLEAGYFIVGNVKNVDDILCWEDEDHVLLASEFPVYELIKRLSQSVPITSMVKKNGLEYFVTYETLEDVKENMVTSRHNRFPVVDEWGYIQGMISKSNLLDFNRKKAILVDHNERTQSIQGIDDIHILEIIDHHRVADVQTMTPLYFRVEPVGCTCTIVTRMYEENEVEIPPKIAGLLLSAILSDTLLFKSPTCTPMDQKAAEKLAKIAKVELFQYGMKLITEGSSLQEETPDKLLHYDMKQFMFGSYKVRISQINTGDFDGFFRILKPTVEYMENACVKDAVNLWVLMVTDVVIGGTELIAVGDSKWIAQQAFGFEENELSIFLPNVFSRKKQVVPQLMNAAKL